MPADLTEELDLEAVVTGLYQQPEQRHALEVGSDAEVAIVRRVLESTVARLYGGEAVLGRGIRIAVERDDEGRPHRVWLWRALVGGQRPGREGFSGKQRTVRA